MTITAYSKEAPFQGGKGYLMLEWEVDDCCTVNAISEFGGKHSPNCNESTIRYRKIPMNDFMRRNLK